MALGFKYGFNWGLAYDPTRALPSVRSEVYPVYSQPDVGWAGDVVTVLTPGLYNKTRDDKFNNPFLDSTLWSPSLVGKGRIVPTTSLFLSAGPVADSQARIMSQQPFAAADATVQYVILPDRAGVPLASIDYICMEALVGTSLYIRVYRTYDVFAGHVFRCDINLNGVVIPGRSINSRNTSGELRVIWAGTSMTVMVRDTGQSWQILAYTRTWSPAFSAYISIFTSNNRAANSVSACRLRSFTCPPGILFDTEPAFNATANTNDVQLAVPERRSYLKTKVPITVFTYDGILGSRTDAFEYVRPDMRVLSYDAARDISTSLKQDRTDVYADVIGIYGPRVGQPDVTDVGNVGVGTPPVELATTLSISNSTARQYRLSGTLLPRITINIVDDHGQIVPSAIDIVTVTLATQPSGSAIMGTLVKSAVGGSVTFDDLHLTGGKVGPYVLRVTSPNLRPAETVPFTVRTDTGQPWINKAGMSPPYRHNFMV